MVFCTIKMRMHDEDMKTITKFKLIMKFSIILHTQKKEGNNTTLTWWYFTDIS